MYFKSRSVEIRWESFGSWDVFRVLSFSTDVMILIKSSVSNGIPNSILTLMFSYEGWYVLSQGKTKSSWTTLPSFCWRRHYLENEFWQRRVAERVCGMRGDPYKMSNDHQDMNIPYRCCRPVSFGWCEQYNRPPLYCLGNSLGWEGDWQSFFRLFLENVRTLLRLSRSTYTNSSLNVSLTTGVNFNGSSILSISPERSSVRYNTTEDFYVAIRSAWKSLFSETICLPNKAPGWRALHDT